MLFQESVRRYWQEYYEQVFIWSFSSVSCYKSEFQVDLTCVKLDILAHLCIRDSGANILYYFQIRNICRWLWGTLCVFYYFRRLFTAPPVSPQAFNYYLVKKETVTVNRSIKVLKRGIKASGLIERKKTSSWNFLSYCLLCLLCPIHTNNKACFNHA